ncbi:Transmembrane domain-containing protein [Spironucleus salmonicida]|uniref:Transmembrane domain-containing protein n=1 Tax=Spironucleus salmonicida TaxID=348837 RepID=V6LLW6_9EUKA|nr:Transmembrane domain-containing protein [Spironucleus salmonicida]|eukprot:EST44701.1 Transmembrane domain-containing protein [Spironucleus salmonicida]
MTQYSRSVESSTSTDVLVYELKDRVQQYQFASPMYHFLVIFRAFFIFIFCLQFDESNAINTFNLITNYEIILIVPQLVGKVAFEIISPILGTAQINAGRVVFNYSIIHYLLISILFFIGFGAYSRFNNLILFSLAPFSQAAISHLFEVGKAERWNMSQIIAALISPTLSIVLYCVLSFFSVSQNITLIVSYTLPGMIFIPIILRDQRYLYMQFSILKPFRPALQLQCLLSFLKFLAFDAAEELVIVIALKVNREEVVLLSICLYYYCMRLSCIFSGQLYDVYVQSTRLSIIHKSGMSNIYRNVWMYGLIGLVTSIIIFLSWYKFITLSVGSRLPTAMLNNHYTGLLSYTRNGALRGMVMPLYAFVQAHHAVCRGGSFAIFSGTVRSLAIIASFIWIYCADPTYNFNCVFTVQTLTILLLAIGGLVHRFALERHGGRFAEESERGEDLPSAPRTPVNKTKEPVEEPFDTGNFLSNQSVNFLQLSKIGANRNTSLLESLVNSSYAKTQVIKSNLEVTTDSSDHSKPGGLDTTQ